MYRIRDLREDHDLSQSDVAKVIGTTQQHYSKIENGKADIGAEKLIRLAELYLRLLGCNPSRANTHQRIQHRPNNRKQYRRR